MHLLLKIIFYTPLAINGLIGAFFFVQTGVTLLVKPESAQAGINGVIVLLGCAVVLGLVWWAYVLAIAQERILAGFGVLVVSYIVWPVTIVAIATFGYIHWQ